MNYFQWVFIIGLLLLLIVTFVLLGNRRKKNEEDSSIKIRKMSVDAMIIAIIILMGFIPNLGYLNITPLISLTLLHIPVLLGAALMGWKRGLIYGTVFGLTSYFQALMNASGLNLLFAYPWTALPPRMILGLVAGLAFSMVRKLSKNKLTNLYFALVAALLTLLHTILVFIDLYIFFPAEVGGMLTSSDPVSEATTMTFIVLIAVGAIGEAILAGITVPCLTLAARKASPRLFITSTQEN